MALPPRVFFCVCGFLRLSEVVQLLSTCRTLRRDGTLSAFVLEQNEHSQHFFRRCSLDWFNLTPRFDVEGGHWKACDDVPNEGRGGRNCSIDIGGNTSCDLVHRGWFPSADLQSGRPQCQPPEHFRDEAQHDFSQRVQLVGVVGFVQEAILQWCFEPFTVANELHVLRPVVISLSGSFDGDLIDKGWRAIPTHRWRAEDIQRRLKQIEPGNGCRLFVSDPHRTSFGVHWDNIDVSLPHTACACCAALEPSVSDYRYTVQLMYRRWLTTATACLGLWRDEGYSTEQIDDLTNQMRDDMLPADDFFNEEMASAGDEDLMGFICSNTDMSHTFNVCPDQPTDPQRYSWRSVFHPKMRSVCAAFIQPFKLAAHRHLGTTVRASAGCQLGSQPGGENVYRCSSEEKRPDWSDLVAGVFGDEFLVGFYYMTHHRNDSAAHAQE